MNPIVIVSADDELADTYVLELRARRIVAVSVPDCANTRSLLRSLIPRAIVVEVECPSQWLACRELVLDATLNGTPVLLLTGRVEPAGDGRFRQRAYDYGFSGVLIKPCPVDQLMYTVEELEAGRTVTTGSGRMCPG